MSGAICRSAVLCLLLAWPCPRSAAAQSAEPPAEYVRSIEQAVAAGTAGNWRAARRHFRSAQQIYPNARALRGIGISAANIGAYREAYRALTAAQTADVLPLTDAQRVQVAALLEDVGGHVTVFSMEHLPGGVTVFLDGREVDLEPDGTFVVPVGLHVVSVRAPHGQPRRVDADLRVPGGGEEPLPVEMALRDPSEVRETPARTSVDDPQEARNPQPAQSTVPGPSTEPAAAAEDPVGALDERGAGGPDVRPIVGYTTAGAGAAGLLVGAIVFARGRSAIHDFDTASVGTPWRELDGLDDDGERQTRVGAALMVLGGVLAATGVVIAVTGGASDDGTEGARASVRVGLTRVDAEITW